MNKREYIGLIIIGFICLFGFYNSYKIKSNGVYGIATIYNIVVKKGGYYFDFDYAYQGHQYTEYASSYQINKNDEGRRFFVLINSKNPTECLIDIRLPVPDSIAEAPFDGWTKLPGK